MVDKEPILEDGFSLNDQSIDFTKTKDMGKFHIDQHELKDIYRDTINFVAHKYIKKYNFDGHYNKNEEKNMEILLEEK